MGFFSKQGPDERRAQAALNRHQDNHAKELRRGDPKQTRISNKLEDRANTAKRQGR